MLITAVTMLDNGFWRAIWVPLQSLSFSHQSTLDNQLHKNHKISVFNPILFELYFYHSKPKTLLIVEIKLTAMLYWKVLMQINILRRWGKSCYFLILQFYLIWIFSSKLLFISPRLFHLCALLFLFSDIHQFYNTKFMNVT